MISFVTLNTLLVIFVTISSDHIFTNNAIFLDTEEHSLIFYKSFFEKLNQLNVTCTYQPLSKLILTKKQISHPILFINLSEEFLKQIASKNQNSITKATIQQIEGYLSQDQTLKRKIFFFIPGFCKISENLSEFGPLLKYFQPLAKIDHLILKLFLLLRPETKYNFLTSLRPGTFNKTKAILDDHLFFEAKNTDKHLIILVKNQVAYYGSIFENFNLTPFFQKDQRLLGSLIHDRLSNALGAPKEPKNNPLPPFAIDKKPRDKLLFAWIEIPLSSPGNTSAKKEIDLIIKNIKKGRIKILWITPAINDLFSKIAVRKENKEYYIKSVRYFINKAKEILKYKPTVLFGIEIANNLVAQNLPTKHNIDVFGNNFKDQPDPLSKDFWQDEVINPSDIVLTELKKELLDLDFGIVLDLEMYLRKTQSTFCSTSGFNSKTRPTPQNLKVQFSFLERKAFQLGLWLRQSILKKHPKTQIAIYMPTIIPNWFYLSFLKGIGNKLPLNIFSFSSNFAANHTWLEKNDLLINHFEFFMLSKLNMPSWRKIIADLFEKENVGFGFNRFSRINKYEENSWFDWEQTNNQAELDAFFNTINQPQSLL